MSWLFLVAGQKDHVALAVPVCQSLVQEPHRQETSIARWTKKKCAMRVTALNTVVGMHCSSCHQHSEVKGVESPSTRKNPVCFWSRIIKKLTYLKLHVGLSEKCISSSWWNHHIEIFETQEYFKKKIACNEKLMMLHSCNFLQKSMKGWGDYRVY